MAAAKAKYEIVVIGGGAAGLTTAARLSRAIENSGGAPRIAIVEPSTKHYYQPMWTLVGAGIFPREKSERNEADYIPKGCEWIQDSVTEVIPEENYVVTRTSGKIGYDFLVVAAGIQIDWGKIPGLRESLGKNGVCSNYSYDSVNSTWENIRAFKGGTAIFTQPPPPFKCGGAPQKIMYLADEAFRRSGVRDRTQIIFCSAAAVSFQVKKYAAAMDRVIARKKIEAKYKHNLIELRPDSKEAIFKNLETGSDVSLKYDLIHVTPPQSAPDFLKKSSLANKDGWVEVNKQTLQHCRFPNVFALGDCSSLPTSKTGAAIRKEAPVLVANLIAAMAGKSLPAVYDGYTSCPLVTGYKSLVMAEFDYDLNPKETFPFDQSKERYSMYLVKAHLLPRLYWHGMLRGRA